MMVQLFLTFFVLLVSIGGLPGYGMSGMVILMFIVGVILLMARRATMVTNRRLALDADENWSAFVTMAEYTADLILGYKFGWAMTKKFDAVHSNFNRLNAKADDYAKNTMWLLQIGFKALTCFTTIVAGHSIHNGNLKVGSFTVLIAAVNGIGNGLEGVATIANTMVASTAELMNISLILNKDTRRESLLGLGQLKKALNKKTSHSTDKLEVQESSGSTVGEAQSYLGWHSSDATIYLDNISYKYTAEGPPAVPKITLEIPPESLVCMAQSPKKRLGMDTLFKIVAGMYLPTSGEVRLNARFKVIYVPLQPILFDGSLGYNLQFCSDTTAAEVWRVCEEMGMSPELIGKNDFDVGRGGEILRHTDRMICSICRALVFGVDVLLVSSGIDLFGDQRAKNLLQALRKYVARRGLLDSKVSFNLRHRKTVIYTSKNSKLWEEANYVVHEKRSGQDDISAQAPASNGDEMPIDAEIDVDEEVGDKSKIIVAV
jgi:ABC-type multidrug transport system fused ATPase/permease subunit